MPTTRRRKFLVHDEIRGKETTKLQNMVQNSRQDSHSNKFPKLKVSEKNNQLYSDITLHSPSLEVIPKCNNFTSVLNINKTTTTSDKNRKANISNIKFYDTFTNEKRQSRNGSIIEEHIPKRQTQYERDRTHMEKHLHRIKVRGPKHKSSFVCSINNNRRSISTCTDLDQGKIENIEHDYCKVNENVAEVEQPETSSAEDMCRICHGKDSISSEFGQMISACLCRGTIGRVHVICLETWLTESGKSRCELCSTRYSTRRVHKYGVLSALIMWLLSQNAKQLIVDGIGILLMSPLAVLAAWLSGRTLVSLMTPEDEIAPWPLASTFILACMTLVCYYCWIVSAATRHALSWWIWYRSHYEIKLQLDNL